MTASATSSVPARALAFHLQTLVLALIVCVVGAQTLLLSPLLLNLAATFDVNEAEAARGIAAYAGATALSAFFLARFIDVIGAGRIIRIGLLVLLAGLALAGLAPRFYWLLIGQAIAGVAAGLLLPAAYNLASVVAPPGKRSAVMGRVLLGWSVAMVAGVPVAAFIADLASWRMAFALMLALAALALIASLLLLPTSLGPQGKSPAPISLDLLRIPRIARVLGIGFVFMLAFYTCYAFLGTYVRQSMGLNASQAAYFVLAYGIFFGVASLVSPVIDRWGEDRVFTPLLLIIAGLYFVMTLGPFDFWTTFFLIGTWGFFNHFVLNMLVSLLAKANPERMGETLGLNSSLTYVASLIGSGVLGRLYLTSGYRSLAALGVVWLLLAALLWATRRNKNS